MPDDPSSLTAEVFLILREIFFDPLGNPKGFTLRDKRNTQDDPLDEFITDVIAKKANDFTCIKAPGPLISPDFVVYRRAECEGTKLSSLLLDTSKIVGVEVKKLERSTTGKVARSTGLDYNTTPPCGKLRIYDKNSVPADIRAFYLFVCQETNNAQQYFLSALSLCDGNVLNEDFEFYLSITNPRQKEISLGTYGDGANRNRPMLIFSNPLGASELDYSSTLIDREDLSADRRIGCVYEIFRTVRHGEPNKFFVYKKVDDMPSSGETKKLVDPFPHPDRRISETQRRGRFRLPIEITKR